MRVKFLQDFQGRETKNIFYKNNEVVDLDAETAELLVREKRAVLFVEPIEVRQPVIEVVEDTPKPTKRGKKWTNKR